MWLFGCSAENYIGDAGAASLATALPALEQLQTLILAGEQHLSVVLVGAVDWLVCCCCAIEGVFWSDLAAVSTAISMIILYSHCWLAAQCI